MIEIKDICKSFGKKRIFTDYSLNIPDASFLVFAGNSGCGKTTLLNMIGGLEKSDSGSIRIDGRNVWEKKDRTVFFSEKVGFLFQNFALVESKTVRENLNLVQKKARTGISIEQALEEVGLPGEAETPVYQLSGGEQQRVALARLMYKKCDVILADEPTGSLDETNAEKVLDILWKLNRQKKTVILVTHNEQIIRNAPWVETLSGNIPDGIQQEVGENKEGAGGNKEQGTADRTQRTLSKTQGTESVIQRTENQTQSTENQKQETGNQEQETYKIGNQKQETGNQKQGRKNKKGRKDT